MGGVSTIKVNQMPDGVFNFSWRRDQELTLHGQILHVITSQAFNDF